MTIGAVICAYLAIGALCAAFRWYVVKVGLDMVDAGDADAKPAMDQMERATGQIPGGMAGVLALLVLSWPLAVVIVLRNIARQKNGAK